MRNLVKIFLPLFFIVTVITGAVLPVNTENDIYNFLERMDNRGLVEDYSGIYLPLTRNEIVKYFKHINKSQDRLSSIEKKLFRRYKSQYYRELLDEKADSNQKTTIKFINDTTTISSIITREIDQREQHLLEYSTPKEFIWGDIEASLANQTKHKYTRQIVSGDFIFRAGIKDNFHGFLRFENYLKFDNKKFDAPLEQEEGQMMQEELYFENSQAGLGYSNNFMELGLYHQPVLWGSSRENNLTLSNNGPHFPYFKFSTSIGFLDYSLIHGSLLNDSTGYELDKVTLQNRDMSKNIAAQRFEITMFGGKTHLGFNEMVIYCNRTFEWKYVIPFSWYYPIETYLEEKDNLLFSLDLKSQLIKNTEIYSSIFFDELNFDKIGTENWENRYAFQFGLRYNSYILQYPLNLQIEYTAVRPWTYTHQDFNNNYTHNRFGLGFSEGPNSQMIYFNANTYFNHRIKLKLEYRNLYKGTNFADKHFGVEPTSNYENREKQYDNSTQLLMGKVLSKHEVKLVLRYEFWNDFYMYSGLRYLQEKLKGNINHNIYTEMKFQFNL